MKAKIWIDSAAYANNSGGAWALHAVFSDYVVIDAGDRIRRTTFKQAEFIALLKALELAAERGCDDVEVFTTSPRLYDSVRRRRVWGFRAQKRRVWVDYRPAIAEMIRGLVRFKIACPKINKHAAMADPAIRRPYHFQHMHKQWPGHRAATEYAQAPSTDAFAEFCAMMERG